MNLTTIGLGDCATSIENSRSLPCKYNVPTPISFYLVSLIPGKQHLQNIFVTSQN